MFGQANPSKCFESSSMLTGSIVLFQGSALEALDGTVEPQHANRPAASRDRAVAPRRRQNCQASNSGTRTCHCRWPSTILLAAELRQQPLEVLQFCTYRVNLWRKAICAPPGKGKLIIIPGTCQIRSVETSNRQIRTKKH